MTQLSLFDPGIQQEPPLKRYLDQLVAKYKTPDFIPRDPIKFPHRYKEDRDREVIGFIAAAMAQGKRTEILASMEKICRLLEDRPYDFVINFDPEVHGRRFETFNHFAYQNTSGADIVCMLYLLRQALEKHGSLKKLFLKSYDPQARTIKEALVAFIDELFRFNPPPSYESIPQRLRSLLPSPAKGSACKRLNMFLRWMIRRDCVDLGLWPEISPSKLIIPLDVHVSRLSRQLGLTQRKTDDWKTAEEITDRLREFDPEDPVKYDFAIFGMGVSGEKPPPLGHQDTKTQTSG